MSNGTPTTIAGIRRQRVALTIVLLVVAAFALFIVLPRIPPLPPVTVWVINVVIALAVLGAAGREINGHWFGILIDGRNKYSLSRLQITLWTVMVLTAFLTMAFFRVRAATDGALSQVLDIRFPEELLLAMGISAASFAGASVIKSNKTTRQITIEARTSPEAAQQRRDAAQRAFTDAENKLQQRVQEQINRKADLDAAEAALKAAANDTNKAARDKAQTKLASTKVVVAEETSTRDSARKALDDAEADLKVITDAQGLLHKNADPKDARWVDLFRGEEIGNYKLMDMSKVQMLFFTIAVIVVYAVAIERLLRMSTMPTMTTVAFPPFSESLNGLLGISHGTYLSVKAVNHS